MISILKIIRDNFVGSFCFTPIQDPLTEPKPFHQDVSPYVHFAFTFQTFGSKKYFHHLPPPRVFCLTISSQRGCYMIGESTAVSCFYETELYSRNFFEPVFLVRIFIWHFKSRIFQCHAFVFRTEFPFCQETDFCNSYQSQRNEDSQFYSILSLNFSQIRCCNFQGRIGFSLMPH